MRAVGRARTAALSAVQDLPHFARKILSRKRLGQDLASRWQEDCLGLEPDWVSILIGVNDTWRRYDSGDATTAAVFEEVYRGLLQDTVEHTDARLILCEPFVLPHPEDREQWREDLDPKIHAVRRLAREFGAVYIPLDGIFATASAHRNPSFWAADGVHPTAAGHMLIAENWLRAVHA
jgi:lysophospholipase L1-like esterase